MRRCLRFLVIYISSLYRIFKPLMLHPVSLHAYIIIGPSHMDYTRQPQARTLFTVISRWSACSSQCQRPSQFPLQSEEIDTAAIKFSHDESVLRASLSGSGLAYKNSTLVIVSRQSATAVLRFNRQMHLKMHEANQAYCLPPYHWGLSQDVIVQFSCSQPCDISKAPQQSTTASRIQKPLSRIHLVSTSCTSLLSTTAILVVAMITDTGRKRQREMNHIPETTQPELKLQPDDVEVTKRRRAKSPALPYIIVHRVECSRTERYHEQHIRTADYLDAPRLLAQSNRKTCLQGRKPIRAIESYLEDHDDLSFAVYTTYSCTTYHESIKNDFTRLPMPAMDEEITVKARPYFFILERDARPALATSEGLVLSEGLQEALHELARQSPNFRWRCEDYLGLKYPYLHLYHQKDFLVSSGMRDMKPYHCSHLQILYNYLVEHLGPNYSEAETLFREGRVDRQHWAKLYRPGAVIVSFEGGHPVAHICNTSQTITHNKISMQCQSWEYDGKFFQTNVTIHVPWPSDDTIIPITDLHAYPLTYARPGLEEELRARGDIFWASRWRNLVNYNVPLDGMEVQIVICPTSLRWTYSLTQPG